MMLPCSPEAIPSPSFFGGQVLNLSANLVENFTQTAYSQLYYGHPTISVENATFCNITVTYTHPGQNDTISVETWLPVGSYNGRLQSVGGGGWVAGRYPPAYTAMAGAIGEGYATSSTDAGLFLQEDDLMPDSWALLSPGNPDLYLLQDLASVSLNDQALIAKHLVSAFYGDADEPKFSYWSGCSQGGRQGLMLAQRFPGAYDGIAANAPAGYWSGLAATTLWPQLVMRLMDYFPRPCELEAVADAVVAECDGRDGIVDGVISDYDGACGDDGFDVMSLVGRQFLCDDTGMNTTISRQAATVAKKAWEGPRGADGGFMWFGPSVGSKLAGSTSSLSGDVGLATTTCSGGNNGTCTGVPVGIGEVWLKYFVVSDPEWDWRSLTLDEFERLFYESVQRYESIIGTASPDLREFQKAGGKMLGFHGMADQIIPVKSSERYHADVTSWMTSLDKGASIDDFYRLFEVPGLEHCAGGAGGQPTTTFDALRAWVEDGVAPNSIQHPYTAVDGSAQGRLLCPYPQKASLKTTAARGDQGSKEYVSDDFECVGA